jgi:hypothetical protein
VLVACIGSLTYGYLISVLAAAQAQPTFYVYMNLDTVGAGKDYAESIIATWNCIMYVGAVSGGACYGTISHRVRRKAPISLGCLLLYSMVPIDRNYVFKYGGNQRIEFIE